jgi:hypothetical protein
MEIEISKKQGERRFIKTLVYLTASDKEIQKVCGRYTAEVLCLEMRLAAQMQ